MTTAFSFFFNQGLTWFNDIHATSYSLPSEELSCGVCDKKQSLHSGNVHRQNMNRNEIKWEEIIIQTMDYLQTTNCRPLVE